jgi:transcription elongation factor/antiterminator RfaH
MLDRAQSEVALAPETVAAEPLCSARWFAVQCLSNREFLAAAQLANQGYPVFLPCLERTRRHARKFDTVRRPLFPGYLFVKFDPAIDRWRCVNGTLGVARLIGGATAPTPVPIGVIEAIGQACDDNGVLAAGEEELLPGEDVRITAGPFSELVGRLESLDGAGRVRVLLEILGRRTSVALSRNQIAASRR